ncbi:MAG: peptide-methionine (S)-S-oxide reductase MsrA [Candidatus Eisenbacteria bacterium]
MGERRAVATLAGGCFWCLEAVFVRLEGVERVVSGYTGGRLPSPSYEAVCSGTTGHAEAIQITFDPDVISYRDLLEIFFAFHDPTTKDRQGPDVGTQYRSAIFAADDTQESEARAVIADLTARQVFDAPIVTEVKRLETFFPAESYHQSYFERNPDQGYCRAMIAPKVAKLRAHLANRLKPASR